MSIFGGRNWTNDLANQKLANEQREAFRREYARQQETQRIQRALIEAQMRQNEEYRDYLASLDQSDIAKEASEGTVIESVYVRKPQPRLT